MELNGPALCFRGENRVWSLGASAMLHNANQCIGCWHRPRVYLGPAPPAQISSALVDRVAQSRTQKVERESRTQSLGTRRLRYSETDMIPSRLLILFLFLKATALLRPRCLLMHSVAQAFRALLVLKLLLAVMIKVSTRNTDMPTAFFTSCLLSDLQLGVPGAPAALCLAASSTGWHEARALSSDHAVSADSRAGPRGPFASGALDVVRQRHRVPLPEASTTRLSKKSVPTGNSNPIFLYFLGFFQQFNLSARNLSLHAAKAYSTGLGQARDLQYMPNFRMQ